MSLRRSRIFIVLILLTSILFGQESTAGMVLKFRDQITPLSLTGVFVLPNELLKIEVLYEGTDSINISVEHGDINVLGKNNWAWKAPDEQGVYSITIKNNTNGDVMLLNCIVMIPFDELKSTSLNGYKIGTYPSSSNELYKLPRGFIEVTEENEMTKISPNYRLKDFLCKQAGSYPKYVVLKELGIIKLESIKNHLNSVGIEFDRFSFISGYRTPFYNKAIGNVKNSRHVFGDAFDVYIDVDKNGRMDDLNNDGKSDKKDVQFLYNKINQLYELHWYKPFIGGLGLYGPNSRRTGFIHIDSRGYRARWGS